MIAIASGEKARLRMIAKRSSLPSSGVDRRARTTEGDQDDPHQACGDLPCGGAVIQRSRARVWGAGRGISVVSGGKKNGQLHGIGMQNRRREERQTRPQRWLGSQTRGGV